MVCPVLGTNLRVTADSPARQYKGKSYYFCCADRLKKFETDPDKYVKSD